MAKTKTKGVSKSGIFKHIFESNKELLRVPSIAEALKQFEAEYGQAPTASDRGLAANIKSKLRRIHGMRRRKRRGGRRAEAGNGAVAMPAPRIRASSTLALEDAIDDCIYLARRIESAQLAEVVRLLKKARNQLIVLTGAK
ncbi:MAG TPA: hypothetical protein VH120_10380 [Gemmataceae bacterium]|nr:hypothetical protein [Gemmataceae bacterium]